MKRHFLTMRNARARADAFIDRLAPYPGGYEGRGIVICGGGLRYFTNAWVAIRVLRMLGCTLPVEIWHLGPGEFEERMRAIMTPYNVRFIDAYQTKEASPGGNMDGWELKPFSVLFSRFKEVLLLDADNVAVRDPEFLFNSREFKATGAIFWPDFGHLKPTAPIWDLCGVQFRDEPEWESGQILVNKERCWSALKLALWYNEHSRFFYQYLLGDKDTYHMAFRRLGLPVAMPSTPVRALKWTLCQHDFNGIRVFQHRVGDKWSLERENDHVWGFQHEAACRRFVEELHVIWFGKERRSDRFASHMRSQRANEIARQLFASKYSYEKDGSATRVMNFLTNGTVKQGTDAPEAYWNLKEDGGKIFLRINFKTEGSCLLAKKERGVWEARKQGPDAARIVLRPVREFTKTLKPVPRQRLRKGDRQRLSARIDAGSQELYPNCFRHIVPLLRAMGIALRQLPSKRGVNKWNLFFHVPATLTPVHQRTLWVTSWNSAQFPTTVIKSLNSTAGLIVPSEWNASCLSCAGVTRPIWVVPPGLDTSVFRPVSVKRRGACVFGIEDLAPRNEAPAQAMRYIELFQKAFPNESDVFLRICSRRTTRRAYSTDPRVHITSTFSEAQRALWLKQLTAFISVGPPQGWPLLEHEALAIGRPLIASRIGGIAEFFSHQAGYPVAFSLGASGPHGSLGAVEIDAEEVMQRMRQVYADREEAAQLGANGTKLVSKFTWNQFCDRVIQIIQSLEYSR